MTVSVVVALLDLRGARATRLMPPGDDASSIGVAAIRRRRTLARALLLGVLADELGRGPWTIEADPSGKPFIRELADHPLLGVSLGHGGDFAVAAFSRIGQIGVDVEPHGRTRDLDGIARYAFGPRERERVAAEGARSFYRIWTLREAMGKATGDGLALAADGSDRTCENPKEGIWISDHGRWFLGHRYAPVGYSVAVAILPGHGVGPAIWTPQTIRWCDGV